MRLFFLITIALVLGITKAVSAGPNLNCDRAPNAYCGWDGEYSLPANAKNYTYTGSCYNFQEKAASIECDALNNEKLCTTVANVCTCNSPYQAAMPMDIIVHCPKPQN